MVSNKIGSTRRLVATREQLRHRLEASRELLVSLCSELGRCDSQNPPGDTTGMIASCRKLLDGIEGITVETVISAEPKVNLVARLAGEGAGPRLVMNGHLDTGPVVDLAQWTFPPFGGVIATDRIYGRGIADMKAGVAAIALAMRTLAEFRGHLRGELVLMLVADEGSGARHGSQYVLETRPELAGDAMLSGDLPHLRLCEHFGLSHSTGAWRVEHNSIIAAKLFRAERGAK